MRKGEGADSKWLSHGTFSLLLSRNLSLSRALAPFYFYLYTMNTVVGFLELELCMGEGGLYALLQHRCAEAVTPLFFFFKCNALFIALLRHFYDLRSALEVGGGE